MKRTILLCLLLLATTLRADAPLTAIITWTLTNGVRYQVDYKESLSGAWFGHSLVSMDGPNPNPQSVQIVVPAGQTSGFYRVYTVPDNYRGITGPTASSVSVPFSVRFKRP